MGEFLEEIGQIIKSMGTISNTFQHFIFIFEVNFFIKRIGSLILKNGDEIKAVFDGNRITGRGMLTKPDSRSFIVDFEDSKILKSSVPFYLNGFYFYNFFYYLKKKI